MQENIARRSIRTDLAMEARELFGNINGVMEENREINGIHISSIEIQTEEAAKRMEKAIGKYVTLDAPELTGRSGEVFSQLSRLIGDEIKKLLEGIKNDATILVVGLGNRYVTPDSLGPRVSEKVYVTRHITKYLNNPTDMVMKSVCAIAPGVLGVTGVETSDIISGLCERLQPEALIVIDSLASRRAARINTTVQITDTGISPGSGIGNTRAEISSKNLNTKVIAIGVPLVVYAETIASDTIELIAEKTGLHNDEEKLKSLAHEVISENIGDMIVTPKDIDCMVEDMAKILSAGINFALHGSNCDTLAELLS